jgi:mRNA-degrading endonuclease HigB of HigAB toxin-antitoxin module
LELIRKDKLLKLKLKHRGDIRLFTAIDLFMDDILKADWKNKNDIFRDRPDANCVHSDGFYFFDLSTYRTMVILFFDDQKVYVIWAGSHDEYDRTFKDNKQTIERWLRKNGLIE